MYKGFSFLKKETDSYRVGPRDWRVGEIGRG